MPRIFISYKRADKEAVFNIKDQIESTLGEKCWVDFDGIESDAQFVNVIMNAITNCTIMLFMYSKEHSKIENYETDWTVRELTYAQFEKKRIVFINIDNTPLTKWFRFMFPQKQQVDATSAQSLSQLYADLKKWLEVAEPKQSQDNTGNRSVETDEKQICPMLDNVDVGYPTVLNSDLQVNSYNQINYDEMAKNDFSSEVADNYEQKCLCVLVLDVSGSMGGSPIQELNQGLQDFYEDISNDPTTSQRLEVALVTFSHVVSTIQSPALVENFIMPKLMASGSTATVDAVRDAIDLVAARKAWYKTTNQAYYRPWIILMTDGEPDGDQDVDGLARQIKQDTANKNYMFLPIGVGKCANMGVLAKMQGSIPPMKLQGTKFSSFFKWLSASMGTVVGGTEGQQVDLSAGADNWMESFTI